MAVTPLGDVYPHPLGGTADRVTRVASLVDGGDVNGLIGWAVNTGALGAVQSIEDWALLGTEGERYEMAKKRGHQLRRASGTKGTHVHQIIAKVIEGVATPWQLELAGVGYMQAFHKFIKDAQPQYLDAEHTVYGTLDGDKWWAGTVDLVARCDGALTYLDWKTGSKHLAYTAQLGGYASATHWSFDGKDLHEQATPTRLVVVYLNEAGTYRAEDLDVPYAKRLWAKAWSLHQTINEKESK